MLFSFFAVLALYWLHRAFERRFVYDAFANGFRASKDFACMAASALVGVGTGTTLVFGTSAYTSNLLHLDWSGVKRKALDSAHMGTTIVASPNTTTTGFGSMTFIPSSLSDPGSLKFKIQFNPDKIPIIDTASETITVTFPKGTNTTGAKWVGTGFVTDFEMTDGLEAIMEATVTVKLSGNVSFTAAA